MNSVLTELYAHQTVTSRHHRIFHLFPAAVGWHKGQALYHWIRRHHPRVTLETGFACGASTLFICQGLQDNGSAGRHHAIDPFESTQWDYVGLDLVHQAGLTERLQFYEASSHRQLPKLLEEGLRVDMAFLDGQKLFDYLLLDCFYVDLMLPLGGVLVFDDPWLASVRKVARFLIRNRGYRLINYTNYLLRGQPASPWLRTWMGLLLTLRYGTTLVKPVFRFEGLLYLQKMRADDRPWDWHREF